MANSREPEKLWPHLAEIRCPVRLVLGGVPHEGDVGADEVRLLQRTVRAFALDSVAGAGHFLYEEQPEAGGAGLGRLPAGGGRGLGTPRRAPGPACGAPPPRPALVTRPPSVSRDRLAPA